MIKKLFMLIKMLIKKMSPFADDFADDEDDDDKKIRELKKGRYLLRQMKCK